MNIKPLLRFLIPALFLGMYFVFPVSLGAAGGTNCVPIIMSPNVTSMGTVTLGTGHNTLTIANGAWYTGARGQICDEGESVTYQGEAKAYIVGHTSITTPLHSVTTLTDPGAQDFDDSLDISSLPNGN